MQQAGVGSHSVVPMVDEAIKGYRVAVLLSWSAVLMLCELCVCWCVVEAWVCITPGGTQGICA